MRTFIVITSIAFLFAGQVEAQSLGEQQKMYNDKANAEAELFHQKEELEQLRQETEKQKQELSHQKEDQDQSIREIKRQNDMMLRQRKEEFSRQIKQWEREKTDKELSKAYMEQQEKQSLKAGNEKAADESELVLNNDYYARNTQTLLEKGFTVSEARKLNELHKSFVYRIEKSATKGDAQAQFMLGMIYHFGFPTPRPADSLKKLKEISQRGAANLSWEQQKEGIIEATELGLEQANDAMYVALSDPELPIAVQNDDKAFQWFQKAAAQKHKGALMVMEMANRQNDSQSEKTTK